LLTQKVLAACAIPSLNVLLNSAITNNVSFRLAAFASARCGVNTIALQTDAPTQHFSTQT
jgi:hypothetical protein